jgi:hypothetical protein
MSIKIMNEVWEHSKLDGTELLMLIAIADHANDDRECWPSMARLAHKCRVSERQAQRIINSIADKGELVIEVRPGRNYTNLFMIPELAQEKVTSRVEKVTSTAQEKVTSEAVKGDIQGIKGDIAMSPEPPVNHQEPPSLADTKNVSADEGVVPLKPKRDSSPRQTEKNAQREAVCTHFQTLTGLTPPKEAKPSANGALWYTPLRQILELVAWDTDSAKRVISRAVDYMLKQNLTISSPKSILNNVRAEVGKMTRTRASPTMLPGATIIRPSSGRPNGS